MKKEKDKKYNEIIEKEKRRDKPIQKVNNK